LGEVTGRGGAPDSPASVHAAAQVFVEDLTSCIPSADDFHHLSRVLRLRPGEVVVACDGRGSWRQCAFTGVSQALEPTGDLRYVPRAELAVTVGFTPVKGDRPEWVVQKLTEVGVDRIVVTRSRRSVVVWEGDRAERNVEHLSKVATHAAAQSRRAWLPSVEGVLAIADWVRTEPLALAQRGGGPLVLGRPVCIGPEGGWSDEELRAPSLQVGLGDAVLRSETAAVVAGALICALREHRFSQ